MLPRRDQRGAVIPMVALLLVALMGMAAFAVDIGMQRVARRDMQALADAVALDLARLLDGRTAKQVEDGDAKHDSLTTTLNRSAGRNDDNTLGDPPTVTAVLVDLDALGKPVYVGSALKDVPDGEVPDGVLVTAGTSVDFSFAQGQGGATRTALGVTIKTACYSIGSFAARFRSGDSALIATLVSPMNELLRPQANLSAADYTALANAFVSLDELAAESTAGSTEQLLTSTLTVAQLIDLAIDALGPSTPANSVALAALDRLANGHASLSTPVLLTNVVSVSPTDTAAMQAQLSVLDLITGTILVADGVHGFQLGNGNLGTKIAGVASLTSATLSVVERPQIACGALGTPESHAQTSQVSGSALAQMNIPTINLGGGDIVQTAPATVTITVALGNATGQLASQPTCASGTLADPDMVPVSVQSGLATYSLTTTLGFKTTLNIAGTGNVDVTWSQAASAQQLMPDQTTLATLLVPPNDTTPISTGSGDAGLGGATVATVATNVVATTKVAGVTTPVATSVVMPTLQPIVNALALHANVDGRLDTLAANVDSYLTPLLTLLGLNISGADVFAIGNPVCGAPELRG